MIRLMLKDDNINTKGMHIQRKYNIPLMMYLALLRNGRSQNTVPIASTQVAIKGIVQYSTKSVSRSSVEFGQLATRHSREHTLSVVGPDAHVE